MVKNVSRIFRLKFNFFKFQILKDLVENQRWLSDEI